MGRRAIKVRRYYRVALLVRGGVRGRGVYAPPASFYVAPMLDRPVADVNGSLCILSRVGSSLDWNPRQFMKWEQEP